MNPERTILPRYHEHPQTRDERIAHRAWRVLADQPDNRSRPRHAWPPSSGTAGTPDLAPERGDR